jgi:methionyl-tRNA formyltransferase
MHLNILFATSSTFTLPIVESILEANQQELQSVVTSQFQIYDQNLPLDVRLDDISIELLTQMDNEQRGKLFINPIKSWGLERGIVCNQVANLKRDFAAIKRPDIGILASFGKILSDEVLAWPTYGWINWHPSMLPAYRGASPMKSALLNGDNETGLSWVYMVSAMDAGGIWLQIPVTVNPHETIVALEACMGQLGAQSWSIPLLKQIAWKSQNGLAPQEQVGMPSFVGKISKEIKYTDFKNLSALSIVNKWRALVDYPGIVVDTEEFGEVKIAELLTEIPELNLNQDKLYESASWLQIKDQKGVRTFLKCGFDTHIEVCSIITNKGKKILFKGYRFEQKVLPSMPN